MPLWVGLPDAEFNVVNAKLISGGYTCAVPTTQPAVPARSMLRATGTMSGPLPGLASTGMAATVERGSWPGRDKATFPSAARL